MRYIILMIPLALGACATSKIQKAHEDGYADGRREQEMICNDRTGELDEAIKAFRASLSQCYSRLEACLETGKEK